MKFLFAVSIVITILGSNPSFASAKLRGYANDDGDADRLLLHGNSGSAGRPPSVKGELLVKFKPESSEANRNRAMAAAHASIRSKIHTAAMQDSGDKEGVTLIDTSLDVPEAVEAMIASDTVEYAEENFIYTHQAM
jgi:hypothetical protein